VDALDARGYFATAGTEHNSPDREPIAIRCKGGAQLPERARRLFSRGACILAAHQHLRAQGRPGLETDRRADLATLDGLANLGSRVIRESIA